MVMMHQVSVLKVLLSNKKCQTSTSKGEHQCSALSMNWQDIGKKCFK